MSDTTTAVTEARLHGAYTHDPISPAQSWDLARRMPLSSTFHFQAMELDDEWERGNRSFSPPRLEHDLESFYWTILWALLSKGSPRAPVGSTSYKAAQEFRRLFQSENRAAVRRYKRTWVEDIMDPPIPGAQVSTLMHRAWQRLVAHSSQAALPGPLVLAQLMRILQAASTWQPWEGEQREIIQGLRRTSLSVAAPGSRPWEPLISRARFARGSVPIPRRPKSPPFPDPFGRLRGRGNVDKHDEEFGYDCETASEEEELCTPPHSDVEQEPHIMNGSEEELWWDI